MAKLTESDQFDIRYSETEDEAFLSKWLLSPGVAHQFTMKSKDEILEMSKIWMSYRKVKSSLTATYKNKPCGVATLFLMPFRKVAHMALGYILVSPEMQRKGIGEALLKNLEHLAKSYFKLELVQFEVYGDSLLIPILKKREYKELFTQEGFIKENESSYLSRTLLEKSLL